MKGGEEISERNGVGKERSEGRGEEAGKWRRGKEKSGREEE